MEDTKHKYVKRTKCDYSMSFKLAVIQIYADIKET